MLLSVVRARQNSLSPSVPRLKINAELGYFQVAALDCHFPCAPPHLTPHPSTAHTPLIFFSLAFRPTFCLRAIKWSLIRDRRVVTIIRGCCLHFFTSTHTLYRRWSSTFFYEKLYRRWYKFRCEIFESSSINRNYQDSLNFVSEKILATLKFRQYRYQIIGITIFTDEFFLLDV